MVKQFPLQNPRWCAEGDGHVMIKMDSWFHSLNIRRPGRPISDSHKISKDAQWYEPSGCISVGLGKLGDLLAEPSRRWKTSGRKRMAPSFHCYRTPSQIWARRSIPPRPRERVWGQIDPNCCRWVFDWLHDTFLIASLHVELKWTEGVEDIITPKAFDGNYRRICPAALRHMRSLLEEDLSQWGSSNSGSTAICLRVSKALRSGIRGIRMGKATGLGVAERRGVAQQLGMARTLGTFAPASWLELKVEHRALFKKVLQGCKCSISCKDM